MTKDNQPIRLLVADDQHLIRHALRVMLDGLPEMAVVAEAATAGETVEQYALHRPDVAIMELRFPDVCGVDAIRDIRAQFLTARVVVLTTFHGDEDIFRALRAGAKAYLLKDATLDELTDCIRRVHHGEIIVPPAIGAKLAGRAAAQELTEREMEVLRRMVAGRSNKEVAADLYITEGTVKTHVNHILDKLGVHDRTQAVTTAITRGMVRMEFPPGGR
ncbi:MAG: two-component response regulator [Gemmataceae bacterium]|nr:two-component response regulator [Gemmataceae bacterium]